MMRRLAAKAVLAAGLAAVLTAPSPARSETLENEPSGLKFDIPKGWKQVENKGIFSIVNPDKDVVVVAFALSREEGKEAIDKVDEIIDAIDGVDDSKVTEGPKKQRINNLVQTYYEGTATFHDEESDWQLTVVNGGRGKKALLVLVIGDIEDYEDEVDSIHESIRRSDAGE